MRTLCCLLVMASFLPASWPAFGLAAPGDVPPATSADRSPLPGTEPLTWTGDIASRMVEGVDRFLLSETAKSLERRAGVLAPRYVVPGPIRGLDRAQSQPAEAHPGSP